MKRIFVVAVVIACLGAIAQAQNTNNPYAVCTTNSVMLTPIANGFGIGVLGYPMPTPGTNFFSDNVDGVALSDANAINGSTLQFFAADEDNQNVAGGVYAYNVVGFRVLQSIANPNSMTVYRNFVACIQTNRDAAGPDSGVGGEQAGTFGLGGVTSNGMIVVRTDGSSLPNSSASPMLGEGVLAFSALTPPAPAIVTNALEPIANGGITLAVDWESGDVPQVGVNGLVAKNSFGAYSYVCRSDIYSNALAANNAAELSASNPMNGTNTQCIISGNGTVSASLVTGVYNSASWNTRGCMAINETAHMMATFVKTSRDLTTGGDAITGLAVIKYTDAGGPINPTSFQTNIFGYSSSGVWPTGGINTNGQYFFSRTTFNGPAQISINDSGAVAFVVSINIDGGSSGNDATNGTRAAQVTGIICQPAGSSQFLKVVDNTDPTLFLQVPVACTNKNLISQPAIDDFNNVYFEATYTNNTAYSCDLFPSNAVYEAVANDPYNPTSWTTRILLRQGDQFIDRVSGDLVQVYALPYESAPSGRTTSQRSFGPSAINRSQLPGYSPANTAPDSAFAVGGILVQATLTNLTRQIRTDALLYIAPYTCGASPLPFQITSIARSGNNINLAYNAQTGTNVIQVSTGAAADGSYPGTFVDLLTNIVSGCPASFPYTDVGGGTNKPTRYYRVNLRQ
ncbi:MAG TPA: hypothetical protein VMV72_16555 [Verrucomicrobiae bacterium]|nr:hypothetical protein [Verrucomicrobiae bacterium]